MRIDLLLKNKLLIIGKEITNYVIPRELDCRTCHNLNEEMTPIGPKPANLNRPTVDDLSLNQIEYFLYFLIHSFSD